MVKISNNTQGNVNITTKNGAGVNINSNNDTDISANMNGNSQRAKSWAVGEGLIDGVDYSAKYYAGQAKESEEIASHAIENIDTAKDEAIAEMETTKEEKIGEIENTAADFEDDLEALTTRAETAATNAETSETNAAASATRAESEATTAYTSASAANFSKNAAETYKNAAETYKNQAYQASSDAQNYATQARGSANTASSKAEEAKSYAQDAATAGARAEQAKNAAEGYAEQAEQAKDDIEAELDNYVPNTRKVNNKPLSADITLTSSDVGALANSTKYGYSIDLSLNTTNYKLTLTLKDQDGTTLNTKTVDFPIESVVVNGSYDSTNKKIVLTLQSGSTIDIPVGDLISGLQTEITSTNKLDSDLVDDTNSSHKFATAAQLNQIATNTSDISSINTNYLTTNTTQDVSGRKTFLGEKAIYFKQSATTNKLGFTLYNPSNTELGAFEWRPSTISGGALLNINVPYSSSNYVGFRYWGTAVNVIAPKVATAGNYYIPTHITNGSTTVTANNNGTINISTLLPDVSNFVTNSSLATTLSSYTLSSSLATVATSGSYNDLSNKPTIPDAQVQADWDVTDTTSKAYIKNKPYIPSGVVVDQTYDGTSTNAQSGVAIAGAGFLTSIPSSYLRNTATGTNSLTLLGTSSSDNNTVNIGYASTVKADNQIAIGYNATCPSINNNGAIAIGAYAKATGAGTASLAVGDYAEANYQADIAIGCEAKCTGSSCIQIGYGTNSVTNSLSVGFYNTDSTHYNWQLLDGTTGLIPDARISSNIARTSAIPTIPTNVSAFTNDSGYITGITSGDVTSALGYTPSDNTLSNVSSIDSNSAVQSALDEKVSKSGDTMSGELDFVFPELDLTTTPSANVYKGITLKDTNGNRIGRLEVTQRTDGSYGTMLSTKKYGGNDEYNTFNIGYDSNNQPYISVPNLNGAFHYSSYHLAEGVSVNGSTGVNYSLANYLPDDNYYYYVWVSAYGSGDATSGHTNNVTLSSSIFGGRPVCRSINRTNASTLSSGTIIVPIGTDRILNLNRSTTWYGTATLYLGGYQRIGING